MSGYSLPCAPVQVHVQGAFLRVREGAPVKGCDLCAPFPRFAAQMPAPGHPDSEGDSGPRLASISLLQSRLHPSRGPAAAAPAGGKPEAGRPVASWRRGLPGARERPPERGPAEPGVPEQPLAGPLERKGPDCVRGGGGSGSGRSFQAVVGGTRAGSAPVPETHPRFVINALGSPRAAQLSSL